VTAGLATLCHDDIRAHLQGTARLREGLHLADQRNAGFSDAFGEAGRVTEGQHDGRGVPLQGEVEHFGPAGEAPGDESAADPRLVGEVELAL
jgi:hypothetical protein